ncbi:MAG: SDR family NAD(P)-dependent oxidoreductase [Bacillota bacterium]
MNTRTLQYADPAKWKDHLFGLTPERWADLKGKSFWITGSGTGYGRSMAFGLAAAGARVFLTGRREEKLKESIQEIESFGIPAEECHIVTADLTLYEEILAAAAKVKKMCGALHGLVNNAALPDQSETGKPLEQNTPERWEKMISTNVTAPWLLTRSAFPILKAGGSVKVLFMTSEAGWASTPGVGMYNVTKAALNSLCHSMAHEYTASYPDLDIQMNSLIPGEARTEMNRGTDISPYTIVSMSLILLSHPGGGPNGKFFHRDGRHFSFAYTDSYHKPLI